MKSDTRDESWETGSGTGEESSVRSRSRVDERVDGIRIAETAHQDGIWYALAVLNREFLSAPGRAAMEKAAIDAEDRLGRCRSALGLGRLAEAVEEFAGLEIARRKFTEGRNQASRTSPEAIRMDFPIPVSVRDSLSRAIREGLTLTAPDSVQLRMRGATTFKVRASWRDTPITGVELRLWTKIPGTHQTATTDSAGVAEFRLERTTSREAIARFSSNVLASCERRIQLRAPSGSVYRTNLDPSALRWNGELLGSLRRSGWSLSDAGSPLDVVLEIQTMEPLEGFSGSLSRTRARLELRSMNGESTSCTSEGASRDGMEAIRSAIASLDCPPF